jgi:hypothetical protein
MAVDFSLEITGTEGSDMTFSSIEREEPSFHIKYPQVPSRIGRKWRQPHRKSTKRICQQWFYPQGMASRDSKQKGNNRRRNSGASKRKNRQSKNCGQINRFAISS